MPPAVIYAPDDPEIRQAAEDELRNRRLMISKAWDYYRGKMQKHLKTPNPTQDDNITVNLCKRLVDRVVSFRVPKFPELELDQLKDTEQEQELRTTWIKNGGPRLLANIVKNGCIAGHCFVRVMPARSGSQPTRIINLDPANIIVFWRGDDMQEVLWYQIQWSLGKTAYRQDIVNLGTKWQIREYTGAISEMTNQVTWKFSKATDWNYPMGPISDWQHGLNPHDYYGDGELGHLALNDKVNKVMSDNSRILRFHASPRTIGTGLSAEDVTATAIDSFWAIGNKEAKVFNLEMQSDLAASMNMVEFLTNGFYAEGRVVVLGGTIADFQRVTNLGIRALYIDQLAKNEELGWQYAGGIEGISQRVRMVDGEADYDAPVLTKWADPLPQDPLEEVQALQLERDLGTVSKQTMAEDLGRNWPQEQERMDQEAGDQAGMMEKLLQGGNLVLSTQQDSEEETGGSTE